MRRHLVSPTIPGVLIFSGLLAIQVTAQASAQERAASLRAQLVETQAKQAELKTRLQQLEDDLKPENIERSLAGVGSTHPEELREARRRQLEIQKKGIQSQLDILTASRTSLEAAIARADTESYHESAGIGASAGQTQRNNAATRGRLRVRRHSPRARRRRRAGISRGQLNLLLSS